MQAESIEKPVNPVSKRQRWYREEYLQSDHWLKTRAEALSRAEYRCQDCGRRKHLDVHHRTYKRLGKERPEDLMVLCRDCHDRLHALRVIKLAPIRHSKPQRPKKHKKPKPQTPRQRSGKLQMLQEENDLHHARIQRNRRMQASVIKREFKHLDRRTKSYTK